VVASDMGRRGVEHSLRFSWDVTAEEIVCVYRELMNGRASARMPSRSADGAA